MSDIFKASGLTAAEFLRDYWQRKPLLLRQALPGFTPELAADDIAGLACEDLAESRLVTGRHPDGPWSVRYGPFEESELAGLPDRDWTLLVQDVEKHYPPLQTLFDHFRFLPRWRIDDLMVSVAAPGGSVGPHVDQYDVFLLQAAGTRQWRIAENHDPALLPDCELRVLRSFKAEREWSLEAGDLLYLPPGVAHHGIATSESPLCMTWSIGMRAPAAADLLQALGDWLAGHDADGRRFRDPAPETWPDLHPGEIDARAIAALRGLLHEAIEDDGLPEFLGSFLSAFRLAQEPAAPDRRWDALRLQRAWRDGARLQQHPWTRLSWLQQGDEALLFASGTPWRCTVATAMRLCDPPALATARADDWNGQIDLLVELLNRGHLIVETV